MRFASGPLIASFAVVTTMAMTTTAFADKRSLMVFKADGTADAKTRAKVDAAILAHAKKATDVAVQPGDISFVDAAAAAGCKPETPACKDDVMATFAVDEIVVVTVTRKPGVNEVWVRRSSKGTPAREAFAKLETDTPLDAVAPLFGGPPPTTTTPPPPPEGVLIGPQPPSKTPPPSIVTTPPVPTPAPEPTPIEPAPPRVADATEVMAPVGEPLPPGPVDDTTPKRGLYIAGMVGGGLFAIIGMGMGGAAGDVQTEIDATPKKTKADFAHLTDLESRGDRLANTGNLLFVAGAVLGGVSTYMFVKKGRHADRHAMIVPTITSHGAGIALSWGTP
ncbi:MAG: hypothetical protein NT062_07540 [Proteobacteria bacterium]|nr:hypothetical protein [Pseudomonadota bacterium]